MRCIGRTKTTNFLRRCGQPTRFLFCWQHIWQPVIGLVGVLAIGANIAQIRSCFPGVPPAPHIRVFLSGPYPYHGKPKSVFELSGGGRTLLFVSIPRLSVPVDRLVFGTFIVRPINLGSRSMSDARLTTVFSKDLWDKAFELVDRYSTLSIGGKYDAGADIQQDDEGKWFVTRTFPRLDPMTGAPLPVSFLLEISGSSPKGAVSKEVTGELEIKFTAPDSVPLSHVLDIRGILRGIPRIESSYRILSPLTALPRHSCGSCKYLRPRRASG